ncbi:hypothetical protein NMG60_11006811 [Bertholletia excelsa]
MGARVSVCKSSDSIMKLRLPVGSKTDKVVTPSPINDKTAVNGGLSGSDVCLKSHWSPSAIKDKPTHDLSSKEETFFDSQPWVESDCEDDFFSVNGDFTPSRGNTPVHHSFSGGFQRVNLMPASKTDPPSAQKKKKLADLFRESLGGDQVEDLNLTEDQNVMNGKTEAKTTVLGLPPRPANHTLLVSGANSVSGGERTSSTDKVTGDERSLTCCLPRAFSSRTFGERRKKMSPTHNST